MKSLVRYINESKSASYIFNTNIQFGNIHKELDNFYKFNIKQYKDYEGVKTYSNEIIENINNEKNNFINKVGKENIKFVKYNTIFSNTDFTPEEFNDIDIPIINSDFINKNYNNYNDFSVSTYPFSILGPDHREKCALYSCSLNDIDTALNNTRKWKPNIENIEMCFDVDEFEMPSDDEEFKTLYKDLTGSSRFPNHLNPNFEFARSNNPKHRSLLFVNPSRSFIDKFVLPFIQKYHVNFIYLHAECSYTDHWYFMYDNSNNIVYYII